MRILHVYKDYFPVLGGIENHIRWLAEAQAAAGHDVTVLVCNTGAETVTETYQGVRVIKAGRWATVASMPLSVQQPLLLAKMRPDIAHLHLPYPLGAVANLFLGRARATVLTYHSDIVRQRRWLRLYAPLLRLVLRRADAIITTSPVYSDSSAWLRPVRSRCTVVPLGIDPPPFRQAVKRNSERPTLLFVGRLRYYKGLDTLLHALVQLPDVHLRIVGDGPMRGSWKQLAHALGLNNRVAFLGDVATEKLPALYAAAEVFVLPANARAEAFGTVLLEAMASGLPVVSTELGTGTSWVNQDGVTGCVVPPNNPAALAQALRSLLNDEALRAHMGAAGQERVENRFTLPRMVEGVASVYEEVLASKP